MRKKQNFSRFNQPVACRMCGKKTTWSDANGYAGLALCKACFDEATAENEHNDNHRADAPVAGCPYCAPINVLAGDVLRTVDTVCDEIVPEDPEPEACPYCGKRNFELLDVGTWECYDCGETFETEEGK